jgi:Protein of unknown function (DUF1700)
MTTSGDAQQKIEAYLGRLRQRLRGMNEDDLRDIVEEIRSHITDKASAGGVVTAAAVDSAVARLGTPEELASQYTTDDLLARAEVSRSPLRILEGLFRWASLSVAGFFVLMGSLLGYFLGATLVLSALLKTIHPRTAGLWLFPSGPDDYELSLRMGFGPVPVGGREVLGWWIVPVGLFVGCGLVVLTTRFALLCVRQYRKSRALSQH